MKNYKSDFPIFSNTQAAYLDNAATTQRPATVLQAERDFYEKSNANPLRGLYRLAAEATEQYENARNKTAKFINATSSSQIIFTRNASEAINLVAYSYALSVLKPGDEILVTITSHHSNLLPWQMAAAQTGAVLRFLQCDAFGGYSHEAIDLAVNEKTKIAAIEVVSNVTGRMTDTAYITSLVHRMGGVVLLDGAQSVPHMPTDVQALDCDFLVFSGHKMMACMGIGVLYGRENLLERMPPFLRGGEMIEYVTREKATWAELPHKFEAGTVNAGGAVSLGAAIDYINSVGFDVIMKQEELLTQQCMEAFLKDPNVHVIGSTDPHEHQGIVSFTVKDVHPHDIAAILDDDGVCIRAGHHCAQPLMKHLGVMSSARASMYFYNTEEDVKRLIESVSTLRERMGYH